MSENFERLDETGLRRVLSKLKDKFLQIKDAVLTVNHISPDPEGNVQVDQVKEAENLITSSAQSSSETFIDRASGGTASISDGDAWLLSVKGNSSHAGYVAEQLNMTVTPIPRTAPDPITAVLDKTTFIAYVSQAGTYTISYTTEWSASPTLYGITVTGTPESGDSISVVWDGTNDPEMTVTAPRTAPDAITATLNRDTFVAYVSQSGTTTLTYTTEWSASPALYGVTVTGTPVAGDQIAIVYVKEERGTITVANPEQFVSTGWNLYDHNTGRARVIKYHETFGFMIAGSYSQIEFAPTIDGTRQTIETASGSFAIPSPYTEGYVFVTGGNNTTTKIWMTWSDWLSDSDTGSFKAYSESRVDLSAIMTAFFPYGLLKVGSVVDEINMNTGVTTSRIERLAYSAENLATAVSSGRAYEYDTNYIYLVRATPVTNYIYQAASAYSTSETYAVGDYCSRSSNLYRCTTAVTDPESFDSSKWLQITGNYTVNDHGLEMFTNTTLEVSADTIYGNNLKNKLERDVLTISQQALTDSQKTQVQNNIGLVPTTATNKTTGGYVADARAIKSLNDKITGQVNCENFGTYSSWTDIRSAIATKAASLSSGDVRPIRFYASPAFDVFKQAVYTGDLYVNYNDGSRCDFNITFYSALGDSVMLSRSNGTWSYNNDLSANTAVSNANSTMNSGVYTITSASTNTPTASGLLFHMKGRTYTFQFAIAQNHMYYRLHNGTAWQSWYECTSSVVT